MPGRGAAERRRSRTRPTSRRTQLAQRLAQGARTPYAYVKRVMAFLAGTATRYDEYPPASRVSARDVPVRQPDRLLPAVRRRDGPAAAHGRRAGPRLHRLHHRHLRLGHQALAGLRHRRPRLGRGVVPGLWLGHVRSHARGGAGARGGRAAITSIGNLGGAARRQQPARRPERGHATRRRDRRRRPRTRAARRRRCCSGALGRAAGAHGRWPDRLAPDRFRSTPTRMLAELERALARSGRPISDGVTLAALERRFRTSPEAACVRPRAAHGPLRRRARGCRRCTSGARCGPSSGPVSGWVAPCGRCGRFRPVRSGAAAPPTAA